MTYQMGQQLGNYKLVRLLGSGGFAEVYLAKHIYLHTQAAIKVLQIQLTEHVLQDFLKEARIIANLEHPNIVHVLEFGIEQHRPYLVMSYAPNGTLRQRYPQGRQLAPATVLTLLKQVVAALDYAHTRKIIHRDVKPENMLLSADNILLLSDFGLAMEGQSASYSQPTDLAGTMLYMAPEQFRGHPCMASDQYSLGIVVYEWLSGAVPFAGKGLAVAVQHAHQMPVPLHERVPALPVSLSNVVMRALQKDPKARFPHIQEFADAFVEACHTHATLFTIPESEHPLSAAIVEAQSARISADTLARISVSSGEGVYDDSKTLTFDSQVTQGRQLIPMRNVAREEGSPLAELSISMPIPVDETTRTLVSERPVQAIEQTEEIPSVTSSLVSPAQHRHSRRHMLLYGLGGLGLVLCLSGLWEVRPWELLQTSHQPAQPISTGIVKTIQPTQSNTGQNKAGRSGKKTGGKPDTIPSPTSTQATHIQPITQKIVATPTVKPGPDTASTPAPAAIPTAAASPTPTAVPAPIPLTNAASTPDVGPATRRGHHGRPLTVYIANVPEIVHDRSTISVQVVTSKGNCRVKLRVLYSTSSQPYKTQLVNTDSTGNGTITWNVSIPGEGKYAFATLVVTAYDHMNRTAFSLPVVVQVI